MSIRDRTIELLYLTRFRTAVLEDQIHTGSQFQKSALTFQDTKKGKLFVFHLSKLMLYWYVKRNTVFDRLFCYTRRSPTTYVFTKIIWPCIARYFYASLAIFFVWLKRVINSQHVNGFLLWMKKLYGNWYLLAARVGVVYTSKNRNENRRDETLLITWKFSVVPKT